MINYRFCVLSLNVEIMFCLFSLTFWVPASYQIGTRISAFRELDTMVDEKVL